MKLQRIAGEASSDTASHHLVLLVAQFEETLEELRSALDARNLSYKVARRAADIFDEARRAGAGIILALAEAIAAPRLVASLRPAIPEDATVRIIVAEHYPLLARDEAILSFAAELPCATVIGFHAALDEGLLKAAGGRTTLKLLGVLGWRAGEPISHPVVTSAIKTAQKRIGKSAIGDQPVRSMDDWFRYNYRSSR